MDQRWVRIPLIGDVEGVAILLPEQPLSEANWQQFMRSLEAMKPGLVKQIVSIEPGR